MSIYFIYPYVLSISPCRVINHKVCHDATHPDLEPQKLWRIRNILGISWVVSLWIILYNSSTVGGRAPRPQSGRQTKGVRLMSTYEICMLILAAVTLVVKLIDMNDHNHKK